MSESVYLGPSGQPMDIQLDFLRQGQGLSEHKSSIKCV